MAARDGMANLIVRLRAMTHTTSSDYTLGAVDYWSDEQLQDILDQHRTDVERAALRSEPEYVDSDSVYYDYYVPAGLSDFEEADTGTEAWAVRDGDGTTISTDDYAANYVNGHIRFTSDQDGEPYYLRARAYDLNKAAAEVWRQKAAHYAGRFDIKTDNHSLSRSQLIKQALQMAAFYDRQGGVTVSKLQRTDLL